MLASESELATSRHVYDLGYTSYMYRCMCLVFTEKYLSDQ